MKWLEQRFRRQFVARGDSYLYRQFDREVVFSREDVEAFVWEWRTAWASPMMWGAMLLFGAVVPGLILLWEPRAWLIAAPMSLIVIASGVWRLTDVQRNVDEAALAMDSVGLGHGRPNYGSELTQAGLFLVLLVTSFPDDRWGMAVSGTLLAGWVALLLRTFWKGLRQRARIARAAAA